MDTPEAFVDGPGSVTLCDVDVTVIWFWLDCVVDGSEVPTEETTDGAGVAIVTAGVEDVSGIVVDEAGPGVIAFVDCAVEGAGVDIVVGAEGSGVIAFVDCAVEGAGVEDSGAFDTPTAPDPPAAGPHGQYKGLFPTGPCGPGGPVSPGGAANAGRPGKPGVPAGPGGPACARLFP